MSKLRRDPAFARCAPFGMFIAMLMLTSLSAAGDVGWLVVARGVLVALALAWFWSSYGELRDARRVSASGWLVAVLAGLAIFVAWIYVNYDWAVSTQRAGFDPRFSDGSVDWTKAILRLVGLGLVVPVMEELFWRSFLLRWIERRDFLAFDPGHVGVRAFVVTTLLFALEHDRWFAGLLAGVVYNALYMRFGNLWVPICAHATTNCVLGAWILWTGNWHFW